MALTLILITAGAVVAAFLYATRERRADRRAFRRSKRRRKARRAEQREVGEGSSD